MRKIINLLSSSAVSTWVNKLIPLNKQSPTTSLASENPVFAKSLQSLENQLRNATHFLKKTIINKKGKNIKLSTLPWFLVIGSAGSGKTTLLAGSHIDFLIEKPYHLHNLNTIPSSTVCDWWVTNNVVLIDVPGSYITVKDKKFSIANKLWKSFLDLLIKWRSKNALGGVIVTISLTELIHRQDREQLIDNLKYSIIELRKNFGSHLPFYFTISKCDLIPGFLDFFYDCSSEELGQAWGVTFPNQSEYESFHDIFIHRFNLLIKRLNKQLIMRLHQERNTHTKLFIKDFPLQMERVKESFAILLKALETTRVHFCLKGVFLTSAIQQTTSDESITYPVTLSMGDFQRTLEIMHSPNISKNAYFIKQFLLQGLINPHYQANQISFTWQKQPLLCALVAGTVIIATAFISNHFLRKIQEPPTRLAQHQLVKEGAQPMQLATINMKERSREQQSIFPN